MLFKPFKVVRLLFGKTFSLRLFRERKKCELCNAISGN